MADIVLPPILQVFLEKLASPMLETLGNRWDMQDNVQKLQSNLSMVQAILEDAEEQQVTNMAVRIWLSKLNDIAHDVEDLLMDLAIHGARITDVGCADKAKKMLCELDMIVDEGLHLNLRERISTVRREWDRRETSYFVVESEVYGREEDKEKIKELLLSCDATEKGCVSCIPIVGMGGLGKTTLAQLAYNDLKVTQYFDVKLWVFVSDHFDAKDIMMGLIQGITKDKCEYSNMNVLHSEIWCLLHNKRYLIVLDDVWTEDQDDWDKLRPIFRGGTDGSKILITTRSAKVALMMDCPTFPYYLEGLSEDACWSLFKKRAFRPREEESNKSLLPIGLEIVRKCGGVALAAKTLGSLMRFKREEREWLCVQESDIWHLDEYGSTGILPALRLSYSRLPPHLKRCFSFCAIFPRGYEIKKEKLILMWMAEGLIQINKGNKSPEDIGNDYFIDLLWMSFFQEMKQCDDGVVTRYKLHDVIYDLAQSIVGPDFAILDRGFPAASNFSRIRHSSVVCDFKSSLIPEELYKATRLRTLLLFSGGNFGEAPLELYSNFKYLLVLNLSGCGLTSLNRAIDHLACLRYLDLSHTLIKRLPKTIEYLSCLQTLNLFNCYNLETLPNLLEMKSLRHVNNDGCEALTNTLWNPFGNLLDSRSMALFIEMLSTFRNELQTLPLLVVGGPPDIMFLGRLKQLRGSLKITHLENVCAEDAKDVNLIENKGIESLGLYWGSDEFCPNINPEKEYDVIGFRKRNEIHSVGSSQGLEVDASMGERLLGKLQPHQNLKRLLIKGYPGIRFPPWRILHLKTVDLVDCRRSKRLLCTLANLQFLTSLSFRAMHSVTHISQEFYGKVRKPFPVLEELVLIDFPILKEWPSPEGRVAFPSLRKLTVSACPQLTVMPLFLSIQHLELRDCNAVVVHSFQNLTSLRSLVIEKVKDLLCFSGTFPANNSLLASLEIKSCPRLRHLPSELGNLAALKSLTIRWCEELSSLPPGLQNLNALESLEIGDCHSLMSLPDNDHDQTPGLSNLRTLSVENCNSLASISIGFQYLSSLENLTIMYCPSLVNLPQGVECLASLRSLTILSCPQLVSLPEELQNLMVLHSLEIRSCSSLEALPDWIEKLVSLRSLAISDCHGIRFLPEGLECLNALQHLSIQDCPQLVERCRKQNGEDWPKIAHVPHKHIGLSEQRRPSEASCSSWSN
ncbi:NB-ARC domain, LRR domain containing protein [Trema orientale]|uniref:NB-ARC domain, LRR domain containing protein n=1 Tax=Trema orientale TaxID=63057 RepID=A0A2P5F7I0_TREOI|nr:NB-ARC domain, LRR domain containing protein [Trema orientale]